MKKLEVVANTRNPVRFCTRILLHLLTTGYGTERRRSVQRHVRSLWQKLT
jgi:hypothetical protein